MAGFGVRIGGVAISFFIAASNSLRSTFRFLTVSLTVNAFPIVSTYSTVLIYNATRTFAEFFHIDTSDIERLNSCRLLSPIIYALNGSGPVAKW